MNVRIHPALLLGLLGCAARTDAPATVYEVAENPNDPRSILAHRLDAAPCLAPLRASGAEVPPSLMLTVALDDVGRPGPVTVTPSADPAVTDCLTAAVARLSFPGTGNPRAVMYALPVAR